jgi:hypothetical protein
MSGKEDRDDKKNSLLGKYQTLLVRYPLIMNATQSGAITAVSVIMSQILSSPLGKETIFNWREVHVMTFISMAWITPVLLWFFGVLEKWNRGAVDKLLIDQFVFSPLFTASIIALRNVLYDGGHLKGLPSVIANVVPGVQLISWLFWIPIRFLTIRYVPPSLALLANSAASLVWTIIFTLALEK